MNIIRWFMGHLLLILVFAIVIYLLIFKSELFQPDPLDTELQYPELENKLVQSSTVKTDGIRQPSKFTDKDNQPPVNTVIEQKSSNNPNPDAITSNVIESSHEPIKPAQTPILTTSALNIKERNAEFWLKLDQSMLPPVQPKIDTPEQYRLLSSARNASEQGDYAQAENLYHLLADELPELPDVLAELAQVYKVQGKMNDYLQTNDQLVRRLANHNRFQEAWDVVKTTLKISTDSADRQIKIIESRIQ